METERDASKQQVGIMPRQYHSLAYTHSALASLPFTALHAYICYLFRLYIPHSMKCPGAAWLKDRGIEEECQMWWVAVIARAKVIPSHNLSTFQ